MMKNSGAPAGVLTAHGGSKDVKTPIFPVKTYTLRTLEKAAAVKLRRSAVGARRDIARRCALGVLAISLAVAIGTVPTSAQQRGNPFAGRPGGFGGQRGGFGPYGSDAGAMPHLMQVPQIMAPPDLAEHRHGRVGAVVQRGETPEVPEANSEDAGEAMFVGCAAGGFLGGFTAATTSFLVTSGAAAPTAAAAAAATTGVALPVLAGALVSATAIGCSIGVATAAVSVSAASLWHWLAR